MVQSQPNTKKHILIVDDVEGIRRVAHGWLSLKGYSVTATGDGNSAIAIYKRSNDKTSGEGYCPIDLVLTDFNMNPVDGHGVFKGLKSIDPNAKICLMTSDIYNRKVEEMKREGLLGILPKPFTPDELEEFVKKYLT